MQQASEVGVDELWEAVGRDMDAATRRTLSGLGSFRKDYSNWERLAVEYAIERHGFTQRDVALLLGVGPQHRQPLDTDTTDPRGLISRNFPRINQGRDSRASSRSRSRPSARSISACADSTIAAVSATTPAARRADRVRWLSMGGRDATVVENPIVLT